MLSVVFDILSWALKFSESLMEIVVQFWVLTNTLCLKTSNCISVKYSKTFRNSFSVLTQHDIIIQYICIFSQKTIRTLSMWTILRSLTHWEINGTAWSHYIYLIFTSVFDVSAVPRHLRMNLCISMTIMSLACLHNAVCWHAVFCACWTVEYCMFDDMILYNVVLL